GPIPPHRAQNPGVVPVFSTIGAGVPVTLATLSATALVKGWAVEDPTTQMLSRAAARVVIVAIATARLIAEQKGLISFSLKITGAERYGPHPIRPSRPGEQEARTTSNESSLTLEGLSPPCCKRKPRIFRCSARVRNWHFPAVSRCGDFVRNRGVNGHPVE